MGFRIKEEPAYAGYDDEDEEESLPLSVLRSKNAKKTKNRKTSIKLEDDIDDDTNYVDNDRNSWKNTESQNTISHDDNDNDDDEGEDNYDTLDIIPNNFDDDDDELLLDKEEEEETFDDSNHQVC